VLQCDAVCCSVLQCVAVYCNALQGVVVCCSVLWCVAVCCGDVFDFEEIQGNQGKEHCIKLVLQSVPA